MLAEPVIDLFKELLPPLIEIASEFVDRVGMDPVIYSEALETTLPGFTDTPCLDSESASAGFPIASSTSARAA